MKLFKPIIVWLMAELLSNQMSKSLLDDFIYDGYLDSHKLQIDRTDHSFTPRKHLNKFLEISQFERMKTEMANPSSSVEFFERLTELIIASNRMKNAHLFIIWC